MVGAPKAAAANWRCPGHHQRDAARQTADAAEVKVGWNGLLIGDMAQPRGGPMTSGHSSHQIGLDVDIWFKPMPDHELSREEREMDPAVSVVAPDGLDVDHNVWTPAYTAFVKTAAEDPMVTRIFRERRDQKGNVQRGRNGQRLACQGAALVGTFRTFSRAACPSG
jgi:penicillin-insensitive murein endopeptidase